MSKRPYMPDDPEGLIPVPDDPKICPLMMIGTRGRTTSCIKEQCALYDSKREACGILGRKGTR